MNSIWLASIDIGKKNFAFYIEEIDKSVFSSIRKIPIKSRYNENGTPTYDFNEVLGEIYKNGKMILFKNSDLTNGCDNKSYLDTEVFFNLTDLLDSYRNYWDKCESIVIEKQMSFGRKYNTMALKIGQHCWSYFSIIYGPFKNIIEFPAYHKTQILGAEKKKKTTKKGNIKYTTMDKPARKKWSIVKSLEILEKRNDYEAMSIMKSHRKKDDLADVICQLQAFKLLFFFDSLRKY